MTDDVTLITDSLEAQLWRSSAVRVALVIPMSGVLGMVGPCALNCAVLAASEVNASGGLLNRELELVVVDGGRSPEAVAADVAELARTGAVDAIVGSHASDVRVSVARALGGRLPFLYTPPYEGGGREPGVYYLGETPETQVGPAIGWLVESRAARRWFLLGNDYVWPRLLNAQAKRYLAAQDARIVGERYIREMNDPEPLLDAIKASRADAVFLTLIGTDLVMFNRAFAHSGLRCARLCGALEEHGLLGVGGDDTGELYASMGYFGSVATDDSLSLAERYVHRFGPTAPLLNGHAQGVYEGMLMLAAMGRRAGSLIVPELDTVADGTVVTSARGRLTLVDRHVRKSVYIGRADGLDFDVVTSV
ncbi:substrate-binding domain-containing protein [Rhizohabitans arisaemae]|uniref:substrate-binding domain-containing protein n=1 Tax=Rhizohabitans arisaemae TaxID=2720610 RepID=UPI0024B0AD85|nr:substrate-binding domain-containing protein [Rhizohabitans arisaemae]